MYVTGEVHGANPRSLSSEHSNVAPGWFAWKVNVADVLSVSSTGPLRIVVSGAGVTCQLRTAGVGSTLPAASRAIDAELVHADREAVSCSGEAHAL